MRLAIIALCLSFVFTPLSARAELTSAAPSGFVVHAESDVPRSVDQTFDAVTHVERWWNGAHSYSGDARNFRLDPRAGGCWCERWAGGSVQHMQVVMVMERDGVRTMRLTGGLGPLQSMAINGALTFTITPLASGAKIDMEYRVAGDGALHLNQIGPGVDQVLMEQFARLIRYTSSGSPE